MSNRSRWITTQEMKAFAESSTREDGENERRVHVIDALGINADFGGVWETALRDRGEHVFATDFTEAS